ncbi:MAG: hypothetical protein ACTHJ0_10160 [Flavipsychrobacter sp.]
MDRLVDHLFVFEGEGQVRDFPGNYSNYRIWLKDHEKLQTLQKEKEPETPAATIPTATTKEKKKFSFKEKREFEQLEKDIPALEKEKATLTEKMSAAGLPYEELQKISARMIEITGLLEQYELRWLELSEYEA